MKKLILAQLFVFTVSSFLFSQSNDFYRGVVLYPSDIKSAGIDNLIDIMNSADLNLLGIHSQHKAENVESLLRFLKGNEGKRLIELCDENNILIEYELHALSELLPRSLFDKHPEYFRMNEKGDRVNDYNMCFTSEGAYKEIEKQLINIIKWVKPTTNRYYFWTDDGGMYCNCPECINYTNSEQALIYENEILDILRKKNPAATLAHLAYHSTLDAPIKVEPKEGIFLEFAPISRQYSDDLSILHRTSLENNLSVFPASTAHILEYWLDASMFSKWDRDNLTRVPWNTDTFNHDITYYKERGIRSYTTFATWMINKDYFTKYGYDTTKNIIDEYGAILRRY